MNDSMCHVGDEGHIKRRGGLSMLESQPAVAAVSMELESLRQGPLVEREGVVIL